MREKEIEEKVCQYARAQFNAIAYKFTSPARNNVPDRMIVFPNGQLIFIEFKAPGKTPTEGQRREISRLVERGQRVWVIDDIKKGKIVVSKVGNEPHKDVSGGFWE